ncbi:MAG TPA: hypothetical protein VF941_05500, partial [Clostridia bacterium]
GYKVQCIADNLPIFVPTRNNFYWLFGKNSKATPLMTGKIAKILAENPSIAFEELQRELEENAERNFWSEEDVFPDPLITYKMVKEKYDCFNEEVGALGDIISRTFNMDKSNISLLYDNENLRHPGIGMNFLNCYDLIKNIEAEFNMKLNYDLINLNTFRTLYTLLDFILEEKNVCLRK